MNPRRLMASPAPRTPSGIERISHLGRELCCSLHLSGPVRSASQSRGSCPLWVKSRHSAEETRCPLYPQKRTLVERVEMSAKCQKQTFCAAAKPPLFDHPVGAQTDG